MAFVEDDFDMQPLSRVKPKALISFGNENTMSSRAALAIKIAECISEWSDLETLLCMLLALILQTETASVLAMYAALENRAAQLRMLEAAVESKLAQEESAETILAIITGIVRPAMKERDKLAHWVWGLPVDMPDALLLTTPDEKTTVHINSISPPKPPDFNLDQIFVVREGDLRRRLNQIREAKDFVARAAGIIRKDGPFAGQSAESLRLLNNEPRVQEALSRLRKQTKNNQAAPQPSPLQDRSGE